MTQTPISTPAEHRPTPVERSDPDGRRPRWHPEHRERLRALGERVAEDLETTDPRPGWVPPSGADLEVLVVGGGQAGLGTAFALRRHGIRRVRVLDAGDDHRVGCWDRYARMHTLRSPKHMKGIELDVPSLHVRRWYEAAYGRRAWDEVELIGRLDWNDYLRWYRDTTGTDVRYGCSVTAVHRPTTPDGAFTVDYDDGGSPASVTADRVVFALGLDGGGGPAVPEMIRALPRDRWFHTEDEVDLDDLTGLRLAVLGGGASGFDTAGAALERGAATADLFLRRSEVPAHNPLRWMEFPGMQDHFADLDDAERWEFGLYNGGLPQPPTQHTIWRCHAQPGFTLHTGRGWTGCRMVDRRDGAPGREVLVTADDGTEYRADVVVAATGYRTDLTERPELAEFVGDIATWADRYPPAAGHPMGSAPYLGDGFQFTPREPRTAPWIDRLHHLSTGARTSMGVAGNQLSGIHAGLTRLGWTVAREFTRRSWPDLMADFREFSYQEIHEVGPRSGRHGDWPRAPRHRSGGAQEPR